MARDSSTRRRSTESRVIFTALGVTVWIAIGFLVGLVAGVISEEPELLVSHMAGRDTEIEWAAGGDDRGRSTPPVEQRGPAPVGAAPNAVFDEPPKSVPVVAEGTPGATAPAAHPRTAAAPAPVAEATRSDAPRFLIQVGAYDSRASAQEVAETLRGKGYSVEVLTVADDGRFRVRVGPVIARDRAEGLAKRLEDDEGLPTWILRKQES